MLSAYSGLSKWQFVFIFSTKSIQDICKYSGCIRGSTSWGCNTLLFTKYHLKSHSRGHLTKGLDTSVRWEKADTTSRWEKDIWPQSSAPSSEAWRKAKLSTENRLCSLLRQMLGLVRSHLCVCKEEESWGRKPVSRESILAKSLLKVRGTQGWEASSLPAAPHSRRTPAWGGCRDSHVSRQTSWHVTSQGLWKMHSGSQGSWNEACHFRREGGRRGLKKMQGQFLPQITC